MTRSLGDYFSLQRGNTYKGALLGLPGPVLLGLGSIARNGGFKGENLKTYGGPSDPRMLLGPGEIYVSLKDVTQSADLLGAVARLPSHIPQGRLTQDTVKLVFKSESAPQNYIYWLLQTPEYRAYCKSHSTGTTNLGLSREDFLAFPVPELTPDRASVVTLMQELEDKIELNRGVNETLNGMAQAIFSDWFVNFGPVRRKQGGATDPLEILGALVTDAAHAGNLAALFPDELGDNALPVGWRREPVIDQANWVNGAAYKKMHFVRPDVGLPVIKISELKAGVTPTTGFTNTDLGSRYRINNGELLFSWSGNPDTSIDTFIWTGGPAWLNQHIFAVRPNGTRSLAFLYAMLKYLNPVFAEIARDKQTTGLGHVTKEDLRRLELVVPTMGVEAAFDALLSPIFHKLRATQLESRTLAETRDYLLPRLMSGVLRVRPQAHIEVG